MWPVHSCGQQSTGGQTSPFAFRNTNAPGAASDTWAERPFSPVRIRRLFVCVCAPGVQKNVHRQNVGNQFPIHPSLQQNPTSGLRPGGAEPRSN